MTAGPAELPGIAAAPIQLDEATALRFIEQSQSLLCVATRDGAIEWANDRWHVVLGPSPQGLGGGRLVDLIHPDERTTFAALLFSASEAATATTMACRPLTGGADPAWSSWHVAPLADGLLAVTGHSIDENVKARVRAHDQAAFLASVLDSIDAAIAIVDSDGRIVETNAQWAQSGAVTDCGVGAPVGADYLALCSTTADDLNGGGLAENSPEVGEMVAGILAGRCNDGRVEYSHWRDDVYHWFEARAAALKLGPRRRWCVVTHLDITPRVVAEREAAARTVEAEMLALVARYTRNAVVITDPASRVRWSNEAFESLTGYSLSEARGRRLPELIAGGPPDETLVALVDEEVRSGGGYRGEVGGRSRDGHRFWVDIEARPIVGEDGHLDGVITVIADTTARRQMEGRVKAERARLAAIMATVPFAVYVKDRQSQFVGCNPAMAAVAGLSEPDDIVGLSDADLPWGDLATSYQADDQRVIRTGEAQVHVPGELTVAGGETMQVLASKMPMRDDAGEVEGLVGVFVDVTEQRRIEAQLANANKLESIGQLAAGVAHEINTPIQYVGDNLHFLRQAMDDLEPILAASHRLAAAIRDGGAEPGQGEALLGEMESADVDYLLEEVPRAVGQSLAGVERVSRIVGAMKEFSHPGAEGMSPIDINRAVESSITVSTNEWKYVADIVTDLAEDLPLVPGIPGELSQVFVNMIVNGAHAISEALTDSERERGSITVSTRRVDGAVEIRISDDGTGIPDEIGDKVFDHFFTTKEVGRGTGQGLSLAHGVVVAKHGGTVDFETELGVGTTFIVQLPLEQATRPASPRPASP